MSSDIRRRLVLCVVAALGLTATHAAAGVTTAADQSLRVTAGRAGALAPLGGSLEVARTDDGAAPAPTGADEAVRAGPGQRMAPASEPSLLDLLPGRTTNPEPAIPAPPDPPGAGLDLLGLDAGGVTIASNRFAGGALWSWVHRGTEYVDTTDYGREIQTALFWTDPSSSLFTKYHANPTEAGDFYSGPAANGPVSTWHPSQNLLAENRLATSPTQSTRAIPLEWNSPQDPTSQQRWGGSRDRAVPWSDFVVGKDVTLNFGGLGPVARYSTYVKLPWDLPSYSDLFVKPPRQPSIQIPTVYLPEQFTRFFTFQPDGAPQSVERSLRPGERFVLTPPKPPASGYMGVIATDATMTSAMGLFGLRRESGGSVSEMQLVNGQNDNNPYANIYALYSEPTIRAGTHVFNTWLITGTLAEVEALMATLAGMGVR